MENILQKLKREQALLKAEFLAQESQRVWDWFNGVAPSRKGAKVTVFQPYRVKMAA